MFSPVYSKKSGDERVMIEMEGGQNRGRGMECPRLDDSCDGGCLCSVLVTIAGLLIVAGLFYIFVGSMDQPGPSSYGPSRYEDNKMES